MSKNISGRGFCYLKISKTVPKLTFNEELGIKITVVNYLSKFLGKKLISRFCCSFSGGGPLWKFDLLIFFINIKFKMPRMFTKDGFDWEFFIVYAKEIPRCRFFTFSKKEDSLSNFFLLFYGRFKKQFS